MVKMMLSIAIIIIIVNNVIMLFLFHINPINIKLHNMVIELLVIDVINIVSLVLKLLFNIYCFMA